MRTGPTPQEFALIMSLTGSLSVTTYSLGQDAPAKLASYEQGLPLEETSKRVEAARAYAASASDQRSYAALVRLLESAPAHEKTSLLQIMLPAIRQQRPFQVLKGVEELQSKNIVDGESFLAAAEAAQSIGDETHQRQFLEAVANSSPHSLAKMKAFEKLGQMSRREGELARGVEWLRKANGVKVKGAEADALRQRIDLLLAGWQDQLKNGVAPPARRPQESKVPVGKPSFDAKQGDCILRFYETSHVVCLDSGGSVTRWQYNLHARDPYEYRGHKLMEWIGPGLMQWVPDLRVLANACLVDGDMVYISSVREGVLHAVDKNTGQTRWRFIAWSWISAPLVREDRLYLGNSCGDLAVLNRNTGQVIREVVHPAQVETDPKERLPMLAWVNNGEAIEIGNPTRIVSTAERKMIVYGTHQISVKDFKVTVLPPPPSATELSKIAPPTSNAPEDTGMQQLIDEYVSHRIPNTPLIDREKEIVEQVRNAFKGAKSGDEEGLAELNQMLAMKQTALHGLIAAEMIARWMPERQFTPHLCAGVRPNHVPDVHVSYSKALAAIGDPSALPALIACLPVATDRAADRKGRGTDAIVNALQKLSGQSFGPDRAQWEKWWQENSSRIAPVQSSQSN